MDDNDHDFRIWLSDAIKGLPHGKQGTIARATGIKSETITRLKNLDPKGPKDTQRVTWEHIQKLVPAVMAAYQDEGIPPPAPFKSRPFRDLQRISVEDEERFEAEQLARLQSGGYGLAGEYKPTIDGALPEIDVQAGAGNGVVGEIVNLQIGESIVSAHKVVDEWKFPEGYLARELNVSPWRSLIMPIVGDSMSPTYMPGDRVVVDRRQTEMTIDAVYVISDGESPPQIKRLQRVMFSKPPMVDIISDNASHQAQRVELALLTIIGRVAGKVSKQ